MSDELKLRVKRAAIGTLAALAALLLLFQGIFAVVVGGERWVYHTHEVRLTAQRLATSISRTEAAQRAILLFGDPVARPRYQSAREDTLAALDQLAGLIVDNPRQVAAVAALRPLVERRLADLAQALELSDAGARDAAIQMARDGSQRAMPIPRQLAAIQEAEGELLAQREGRVQVLRILFMVGGLIMAALLGVLLWRQFHRAVSEAERETRERANLERMLQEKLSLLREINHRVGNSLAMVGALLHIQTTAAADTAIRSALLEARARVSAVGRVHQRLMNAGTVDTLDLAAHLPGLCDEIAVALERGGQLAGRVWGSMVVPVETGVALSLLINEIAGPALAARPPGCPAEPLRVLLRRERDNLVLTLSDPEAHLSDPAGPTGDVRGMVVTALMDQLGAIPVRAGDGSELRLDIPGDTGHSPATLAAGG